MEISNCVYLFNNLITSSGLNATSKKMNLFALVLSLLFNFFVFFVPGKDVRLPKYSQPHMTSSLRETPMKHSQVPDKVPPPPSVRMLTLQSPQLCNRSRHSLQQQPVCSSASVPSSQGSFSPSRKRLHSTPRHRLVPLHQSVGSSGTNSHVPLSSTRNNSRTHKSQAPVSFFVSSASPKIERKDVKHHSTPPNTRNNPATKIQGNLLLSKNVKEQRHKSHKVFAFFNLHMMSNFIYIIYLFQNH